MPTPFHKMHGLGNDFVIFDGRQEAIALGHAIVRRLADRKTGIGCDQLILIEPSSEADAAIRIWNADGGEVEACGNAARCVAQLLGGGSIATAGGGLLSTIGEGGATIDLPPPAFEWQAIPLAEPMDTLDMPVAWDTLERPVAVNVGNPHVVFFVEDIDAIDLAELGPRIEQDPLFPERINVNVATIEAPGRIRLRVWERGVGLTRACGTGACATTVAAARRGFVTGPVTIALPGGELVVDWRAGERIRMSGPATHVFSGEIDLEAFA